MKSSQILSLLRAFYSKGNIQSIKNLQCLIRVMLKTIKILWKINWSKLLICPLQLHFSVALSWFLPIGWQHPWYTNGDIASVSRVFSFFSLVRLNLYSWTLIWRWHSTKERDGVGRLDVAFTVSDTKSFLMNYILYCDAGERNRN